MQTLYYLKREFNGILLLSLLLSACHSNYYDLLIKEKEIKIITPQNKIINTKLAITDHDKERGLSGVIADDFPTDSGLLFIYTDEQPRVFWMPDTYFNLDIVFLSSSFKIIKIVKNIEAHPGIKEPPPIARTPAITCQYVLEIRSDSIVSPGLKEGMKLDWRIYSEKKKLAETHHLK